MEEDFFVGPWFVDRQRRALRDPPQEVGLSENELAVLVSLAQTPGEPRSREFLLHEVLGYAPSSASRAIDACLHRLRHKLGGHPTAPKPLQARRGVGVFLVDVRPGRPSSSVEPPPPGRAELATQLRTRLQSPGLITLVGASGIGKSSLARHVCAVEGGIWIDAHTLTTASALEQAIVKATGVTLEGLAQGLSELLVIDNFEQLSDDAARTVAAWAAQGRVLVTSIRPLRVAAEYQVKVPPLDRETAREVLVEQAERLAIAPDTRALDRILDRVDGHPLALLLLAPLAGSLRGLRGQGLLRVASDQADSPDRHRSLESAIQRCLGFVSQEAQSLLVVAAAFRGGFRVDALAKVFGADIATVLGPLRELVRHSLVEWDGDVYRLLPAVRLFAHTPVHNDALAKFLVGCRELEMQDGTAGVEPYADDLVWALQTWEGPEIVDLLFAAEMAGTPFRRLKTVWETRSTHPGEPGDIAGVRSYLCRASGADSIDGIAISVIHASLRTLPPTPLSLFERHNIHGELPSFEQVMALEPAEPTALWMNVVGTLLDDQAPGTAHYLQRLRTVCHERDWFHGEEVLAASIAIWLYRRGNYAAAYQNLRDQSYQTMYPIMRVIFQLTAWELGMRDQARLLNRQACVRAEEERTPHQLFACRAVGAALAHLEGDPEAPALAEAALATRFGGTGVGMDTVARLVLVLHGRASSCGDAEVDAALKGEPYPLGGPRRHLLSWLLAS